MAINWKLRSTVFQLLVAVHAELGEEAFKGRYMSIARYFGPEASYDAIKSFFAKEISKASNQLKAANPDHHGSGKGVPLRGSAGPSRRPPHLYFDDEDISVLTQREVEAAEARFGQSMRAPAKRPRVIKASPRPSTEPEVLYAATVPKECHITPAPVTAADFQQAPTTADPVAQAPSHSTVQSDSYHTAPENRGSSRKRPFSEFQDSIEPLESDPPHPTTPPHVESFGYVTNQGQYRCALCMSQLPSKEDLDRHERISKEHLRNFRTEPKLAKGREKLAQVTAVPAAGRHHNTPAPLQPMRIDAQIQEPAPLPRIGESSYAEGRAEDLQFGTPSDTIEVRGRAFSSVPFQLNAHDMTPTPQSEMSNVAVEKGKGRAISLASPFPPHHSEMPTRTQQGTHLQTPPIPPSPPDTRPTTARTEIGTLNTPHTIKAFFAAPPQQALNSEAAEKREGNGAAFSVTELADVMRSTEIILQLMGCVQREAKAVAASHSDSTSFDSGVQMRSNAGDELAGHAGTNVDGTGSAEGSDTVQASTSTEASQDQTHKAPHAISAPGIDVYTGMRREAGHADGNAKGKARRKDTGSEVSFIVLE